MWVDLSKPTDDELRILSDVFKFHELSVEDARAEIHHPKVEWYNTYLYVILHGINFQAGRHRFATRDVDFFVNPTFLVTIHDGSSRSIQRMRDICPRNSQLLGEGTSALMHRIVDAMVDHYRPEVEKLGEKMDDLERQVFERPHPNLIRGILALKRDVASLRRITLPQRDIVSRLGRREFPVIDEQVSYRFRDVYDNLVRISDEALILQDRTTGLLEAHLSNISNRLNEVMKVLTLIATVFMPLTVLTGMFGMNVDLPRFPGSDAAQFWWISLVMLGIGLLLWVFFKSRKWL
jgi:magnesium transporter